MFSISLLAAACFAAPLGLFMSLRERHKALAATLAVATVFVHTLAWVWAILAVLAVKEPNYLLLLLLVGAVVEVITIGAASVIAEELH